MISSAVTRFSPPYVTLSVTAELLTGLLQKPCKQTQLVTGNSPVTAEQPPLCDFSCNCGIACDSVCIVTRVMQGRFLFASPIVFCLHRHVVFCLHHPSR
mgnify:CR=1 FL=1